MRKVLLKYGIGDDAEITQPLAEMDPGKATKLILNWLTLNAKSGYDVELRLMVPEEQMVYRRRIRMRDGTIFVQDTREVPELIDKALHQWNDHVNYPTLTKRNNEKCSTSILQELYEHHRDKAKMAVPIIKAENENNVTALKKL